MLTTHMSWRTRTSPVLGKAVAFFVFFLSAIIQAYAGQASLAWDANPDIGVVGYMLHYGEVSGNYISVVDAGTQTSRLVGGLIEGKTYYYAVTAYDSSRVESNFSNEVSGAVPYSAPIASFSASTHSGFAPFTVAFTSTSTGTIVSYAWNFGDGATDSTPAPTHSYTVAGTYAVSLSITGPGGTDTVTKASFVTVSPPSPPPVASFNAVKTSGTAPLLVNFSSTSSGTINSYMWDFGDGSSSTARSPSHSYNAVGVYTVALTVNGPSGSNTQRKSGYIAAYAPAVASFGADKTSGIAPLTINFSSMSSGTIAAYAWNFGDGTTSTLPNPSHAYASQGTYTVSLTVADTNNAKNTQTRTNYIAVLPSSPIAKFTSDRISGIAPLPVNFVSTSTGAISNYAWSFGDGTISAVANPSHTYANAGSYSVSLTVSGSGGSDTTSKVKYITVSAFPSIPSPPLAAFSADSAVGMAPLLVAFTSAATGTVISYFWNFGDGATSTDQHPVHSYATPGNYTVSLVVGGPSGSNTLNKTNYISVGQPSAPVQPPVANFTSDITTGAAPLLVKFLSASTGTINSYAWDFGDGATSTEENPTHIYVTPGTYSVNLALGGLGITSTQTKNDYLSVTQASMPQGIPQPAPPLAQTNGGGGGGCAIGGVPSFDPSLWLMLLAAGYWIIRRKEQPTAS